MPSVEGVPTTMTTVDIHTHMVSEAWLEELSMSGTYSVTDTETGDRAVFKGNTAFMTLTPGMFDYDLRIREMDAAGVDVSVVSLTCPNVLWGEMEASVRNAVAMNDQMADAQELYLGRIRFLASLPWQYPAQAVEELARAYARGAVGVIALANIDGRALTDPFFSDIWSAIQSLGLPVLVHPTSPVGVEQMDMSAYHLVWSVGFTFDTTLALARMIMDGFFDRYPSIKIIGSHGGGYLPFIISRLDAGYRSFAQCRTRISRLPSSYLDQVYVDSIVYSAGALALTVDVFGVDKVLFGTDYPHKNGNMAEILAIVGELPRKQRDQILGINAQRIFNL